MEKLARANRTSLESRLERDAFGYYLDQIGQIPVPSHEEQLEMSRAVQAALAALESAKAAADPKELDKTRIKARKAISRMAFFNLRLVPHMSKYHKKHPDLDFFDLIQGGNVGLLTAVKEFDPELGFAFSTYAAFWIRAGMQATTGSMSGSMRKPKSSLLQRSEILKTQERLTRELGCTPRLTDIADNLDLTLATIERVLLLDKVYHLEKPLSDEADSLTFGDLLINADNGPEDCSIETDKQQAVGQALTCLDEREERIIRLRFGFEDGQKPSYRMIGRIVGLSHERVRQLEKNALLKLRGRHGNQLCVYLR